MRAVWTAALALALSIAWACGTGESGSAPPTAAEGMCVEHGVLEALCTKCNPALIPVFQSRGDWCEEHGFPESICPICHPETGGRPETDVTVEDEAPADGTKVRLATPETAARVGIATEPALAADGATTLTAPARIVYDATRVALVNARAPGVVQAIDADVGARVEQGAPLATIESAEVGADQALARAAGIRVEAAQEAVARATALRTEGIGSERDLNTARQELATALGEQRAAQASLHLLGRGSARGGRYVLASPLAGVVTLRAATIGRLVGTEELLFQVVDTSAMWAEIDVPEDAVHAVAPGARVTFAVDGLPGAELSGEVTYLAPEVDAHTRSVRARVPLTNPDGALRANMFAEATLEVRAMETGVWVPREALQRARDAHLVFVRLSAAEYEARRVEPTLEADERVLVRGRLAAGEPVVTTGSFLLKTETLRGSIGAGCCAEE